MCTLETTHALTCKFLNKDAHLNSCSRKSCGMLASGNTALSGNSGPVEATLLMYMVSKHTSHSFTPRLTQSGKVLMQDICTNEIWDSHSNVTADSIPLESDSLSLGVQFQMFLLNIWNSNQIFCPNFVNWRQPTKHQFYRRSTSQIFKKTFSLQHMNYLSYQKWYYHYQCGKIYQSSPTASCQ